MARKKWSSNLNAHASRYGWLSRCNTGKKLNHWSTGSRFRKYWKLISFWIYSVRYVTNTLRRSCLWVAQTTLYPHKTDTFAATLYNLPHCQCQWQRPDSQSAGVPDSNGTTDKVFRRAIYELIRRLLYTPDETSILPSVSLYPSPWSLAWTFKFIPTLMWANLNLIKSSLKRFQSALRQIRTCWCKWSPRDYTFVDQTTDRFFRQMCRKGLKLWEPAYSFL